MGWWFMVTHQYSDHSDLRNVIIHGNSSEQDLVQTCSNPLPRHSDPSPGPKPANVTREQVQHLQVLQTVANCKWRPSQNLPNLWLWPYASMPQCLPFFCGIDNDETPPGVLLRFYSRLWHSTLTDAGTNLVQTHSPGLGCRNFRCAGREFNFHLQNKSTAWRLLALRISLFHLPYQYRILMHFEGLHGFAISFCSATTDWW